MTADNNTRNAFAEATALRRSGDISAGAFVAHVQKNRDAVFWHQWAMRALLVLGAAHLLAGVVFFFAYNWDDLTPFTKFGILQAGLVLSFITALALGIAHPGGQAMLIAASVFTGVLFAVIGQVYQTGADAWELFAAWTALTIPWVLASRSAAHWLFWIILCITAVTLYGHQVMIPLGQANEHQLGTFIAMLTLLFLGVREFAVERGVAWLKASWFRRTLIILSMLPLFLVALEFVFDQESALIGFIAFLLAAAAILFVYLKVLPDFLVLAVVIALSSLLAMALGGRLIFEIFDEPEADTLVLALLLLGGWCVFVTTTVVKMLNFLFRQMPAGADHE